VGGVVRWVRYLGPDAGEFAQQVVELVGQEHGVDFVRVVYSFVSSS
jgi:hypothetical protein